MKKWFKVAMCALMVCALSSAFTGCINNSGTSWLNQLTCEHEWEDGVVTKEATCTEEGTLTKTCSKCEKVQTEKAPKTNHDETLKMKTDPTCDVDGEALWECNDCGALRKEVLKAEGHSAVKCLGVDATCGADGYTDYIVCEKCDEVLTASEIIPTKGEHTYGADGLCTVCQKPKAEEVLAMYTAASNVTETQISSETKYNAYTVIRIYRGGEEAERANGFTIKEANQVVFKFVAYDLDDEANQPSEFFKNFPYYISAASDYLYEYYGENGSCEATVEGDFAYNVCEDYIDFCFGKKFVIQATHIVGSEITNIVSPVIEDGFTLNIAFFGDGGQIKVLSV